MYKKKRVIVFGCGNFGKAAYFKLKKDFDIVAYTDNNAAMWGNTFCGIEIIPPDRILELYNSETFILIAAVKYREIYQQLTEMGISKVLVWKEGFLYYYDEQGYLYPYLRQCEVVRENPKKGIMRVLFVQVATCIRTNKIAKLLKARGVEVYLAYLSSSPEMNNKEYLDVYCDIFPFYSMEELIEFVNQNYFNIVHSSNTPDYLTELLTYTNKPIVHDCHDFSSVYLNMSSNEMAVEHIANVKSTGVIYPTYGLRNLAVRKFMLPLEKTFVLENLISEELSTDVRLEKVSNLSGDIHCVYEGGISGEDRSSHRYYEDIWLKIAEEKVHIHFYSPASEDYCRKLESKSTYLHYEGNKSSKELAVEMSKYDVGLCVWNVTGRDKYLEESSPNKIYEYVNVGIPIAVSGVNSQIEFVETNQFGRHLDIQGNIREQLDIIKSIAIPKNILREKQLTMERKIPRLIEFYESCIERYHEKC